MRLKQHRLLVTGFLSLTQLLCWHATAFAELPAPSTILNAVASEETTAAPLTLTVGSAPIAGETQFTVLSTSSMSDVLTPATVETLNTILGESISLAFDSGTDGFASLLNECEDSNWDLPECQEAASFLSISSNPPKTPRLAFSTCDRYSGLSEADAVAQLKKEKAKLSVAVMQIWLWSSTVKNVAKRNQIEKQAWKVSEMLNQGPLSWSAVLDEIFILNSMMNGLTVSDIGKASPNLSDADFLEVVTKFKDGHKQMAESFNEIVCLLKLISKETQDKASLDRQIVLLDGFRENIQSWQPYFLDIDFKLRWANDPKGAEEYRNVISLVGELERLLKANPIDYKQVLSKLTEIDAALEKFYKALPWVAGEGQFGDHERINTYRKQLATLRANLQRAVWAVNGTRVD